MSTRHRGWTYGVLLAAFAFALLVPMARVQSQDAEGCHDSPLMTRYPGSSIVRCFHTEFGQFVLPLGPAVGENKLAKSMKVEGKITRIMYLAPDQVSPIEIWNNYETALKNAGFATLFRCHTDACRNGDWDVRLFQNQEDPWDNYAGYQYQLTAQQSGPNGTIYVSLHLTNKPVQITLDIVEPHAMAAGMIRVNATAMAAALSQSGHIALYGIYFDTGKADLKPASNGTLREIAALLKRQPTLKLYVVGDTDNVGDFASNMDLSDRRAAAVVTALTEYYGIDARRLKAVGIGPVDPVSTNRTPEGRSRNRRVELVEQ
ncbi:MAG: OmpA family protein [Acidithiobacillus sp.]|nr:OmpA family protein [Acidithiobacillus sp.]